MGVLNMLHESGSHCCFQTKFLLCLHYMYKTQVSPLLRQKWCFHFKMVRIVQDGWILGAKQSPGIVQQK